MTTTTTAAPPPTDLLHELKSLAAEAETLLTNPQSDGSAAAFASLRAQLSTVQAKWEQAYDRTKQQVVDGAKTADVTIRDHPYQALAIALGVGVLVGVLIGRRSH